MTATMRKPRLATPARWQAALERALDHGLQLYQITGTGQTVVTSGSQDGIVYRTDGVQCECPAALFGSDPVCQHRALYWHTRGALDLNPPVCRDCNGTGVQRMYTGGRLNDYWTVTCDTCRPARQAA